jgi:hypothetical protein
VLAVVAALDVPAGQAAQSVTAAGLAAWDESHPNQSPAN